MHTGDPKQRVTVPMPSSLHELEKRAVRLFGNQGKLKLYHRGITQITDPEQLAQVGDGDVVVVTLDDRRLTQGEVRTLLSTSHAEYVKHPLPAARPTPLPRPAPIDSVPFEGTSAYKAEFINSAFS